MKSIYYYIIAFVIAVALIAYAYTSILPNSNNIPSIDNRQVSEAFLENLTGINNATFSAIGLGILNKSLINEIVKTYNGTALNVDKPTILYIGADYCPFCAATRWALIIALSRFGKFYKLHFMTSSPTDYSPNTPTFTFYKSSYSRPYINFVAVELYKNTPLSNGGYPILQVPTPWENATINTYDPSGSIPFIDFNNKTVQIGSSYNPLLIDSYNYSTILNMIHNNSSIVAKAIISSANLITAEICNADHNEPSSVCNQTYIKNIEAIIN